MRRILLSAAVLFGMSFAFTSDASAQWPRSYSSYIHQRHSGHYHSYRPSYRYHGGHRSWHDTSHYDYHPGGYYRHGNHYHYVPGHYDFHRDGHWHYR